MSKRENSDNNLDSIVKKLRKLEKVIKRDRYNKQSRKIFCSSSNSSSGSSSSIDSDENATEVFNEVEENVQNEINISPPIENVLPEQSCPETSTSLLPIAGTSLNVLHVTENNNPEDVRSKNEFIEILGEDPSGTVTYGPEIHKEIASRFTHLCASGLDKENRKNLIEKHIVPINCINIAAPQLNAEIKAAVSDSVVKCDKAIEYQQKQLTAAISSLGCIISNQLVNKDNNKLTRDLMDLGRLLCDIQHSQSIARRSLALNYVKKELKDHLASTKIDSYLFGENLAETLKTAKAVSRLSSDLKAEQQKHIKPVPANKNNLNWKARSSARRQPTSQTPRQQPAAPRAPPPRHAPQTYSRHSKQSRRQ